MKYVGIITNYDSFEDMERDPKIALLSGILHQSMQNSFQFISKDGSYRKIITSRKKK